MAQIILDSNNNLIQGDFDNATLNNRTKLQTTTTNATTNVYVVPNGTSTSAGVSVSNNSNLTNASKIVMATNGTTDTQIISGVNGSGTYLPMSFYTNNALAAQIDTSANLSVTGRLSFSALSAAANIDGIYLQSGVGTTVNTATGNNMTFNVGTTERIRITGAGYLKVSNNGTYPLAGVNAHEVASSAADTAFFVTNSNANPYGSLMYFSGAAPNGTGNNFLQCQDTSAQRANIRSNGGLANYSGNNVNLSDQREKTNIELAGSYLDKVCAIPVKTFNYIDQNMEEDGGLTLGVIAQDVQAVAPELIMESNWAGKDEPEKLRLSIYQTDLQYALMKCIQEQQAIINELKTRIEALENK